MHIARLYSEALEATPGSLECRREVGEGSSGSSRAGNFAGTPFTPKASAHSCRRRSGRVEGEWDDGGLRTSVRSGGTGEAEAGSTEKGWADSDVGVES